MGGPVEALDLLGDVEVVEDNVLREAQLVHGADGQGVVDHVGRCVALGRRVDVHAEPVFDVRPGRDVLLDDSDPRAVPAGEPLGGLRVRQHPADLADRVGVVAIDRLLPFLVGIEEQVPVGRLERGPLLRVSRRAVGEGIDPALGEVTLGIGLNVDRDVLVDARPALLGLEVVVGTTT